MKKTIICTLLAVTGAAGLLNFNNDNTVPKQEFAFKNISAITLGYDKSMGEKTIKAAVIDSYFRDVAQNGKIIRWNTSTFPLKVYIQDSSDVPDYYRQVVMGAYMSWQRASEGLIRFKLVETPAEADMKCYFKDTDNKNSIGVHTFTIDNGLIKDSTIVFNKSDAKGHSLDSKQLYSSALQEIGHSLGLTGKSKSIYDVMYPIGTKFNTEITERDLKTLALVYSVVPDVTNAPISDVEKSQLLTVNDVLNTLNNPQISVENPEEVTFGDINTHLALAEEYRKKAEYEKAAKEYNAVAELKDDLRSKSEVYYEVAVMYLDAEEYDNAKSCADIAYATDVNDLTETLPALINYYTKRSDTSVKQLEDILKHNPYNKHAYKLLCQIYREKHQEFLLNSVIRRYRDTAGEI